MFNTELYDLKQSVTLPTGFATVPIKKRLGVLSIEHITDNFLPLTRLRISFSDNMFFFYPLLFLTKDS